MGPFDPAPLLASVDSWPSSGELIRMVVVILDVAAILSVVAGRGSRLRKLGWTLAIVLLPLVGMALYFLCGRSSTDV